MYDIIEYVSYNCNKIIVICYLIVFIYSYRNIFVGWFLIRFNDYTNLFLKFTLHAANPGLVQCLKYCIYLIPILF